MAASGESLSEKMIKNNSSISDTVQFSQETNDFKDKYYTQLMKFYESQTGSVKKPWTRHKVIDVIRHLRNAKVSMEAGVRRTPAEYYWCSRYDLLNEAGLDYLILKKNSPDSPTVRIIPLEDYYDILLDTHKACGHGGRDKIQCKLKDRLVIVRKAIDLFVALCPICESKRNIVKKGIVTKPILSKDFSESGQVDLIDFQSKPDGKYKWLLKYQTQSTKFVHLRPLFSNQASEVAFELVKIFLEFGAPYILQSDNGMAFIAKVIEEMVKIWPECEIIHGTPRHPQTQISVECSNQDIENMLQAWMRDNNNANWSTGCYFVQYSKNTSFHRVLGKSPFQALFGYEPKFGVRNSNISNEILSHINTEEQLQKAEDEKQEPALSEHQLQDLPISNTALENKNSEASFINVKPELNTTMENFTSSTNVISDINTPKETHENPVQAAANDGVLTNAIKHNSNQLLTSSYNKNIESNLSDRTPSSCNSIAPGQSPTSSTNTNIILKNSTLLQDSGSTSNSDLLEQNNNLVSDINISSLKCFVCQNGTSGAHQCYSCLRVVHSSCGVTIGDEGYELKILCFVCKTELDIQTERKNLHQGMKRAAEKMICDSALKLPALDIGDSIFLNVPKLEKETMNAKNIMGRIIDIKHGVYRIGTSFGVIKNWFSRQELNISSNKYLGEIPETVISLKELISTETFGGHGSKGCTSKPAENEHNTKRIRMI